MTSQSSFVSKVLLFGEYTIINGGSALAIPFDKYSGSWEKSTSNSGLNDFFSFLSSLEGADKKMIEQAKRENWIFQSSIPLGYGLGSSGALTAASYASFFSQEDIGPKQLQEKLATIESYFHGKSSGLDPLASYLNKPIRIKKNNVKVLEGLSLPTELFLYDSQKARKSKPLIQHYKMMMDADPAFQDAMAAQSKFNDRIIEELIDQKNISATFKELSLLQYDSFDKMIPSAVKKLWKKGLDEDSYYFKLSGAGGGGFFLVFSNNRNLELDNTLKLS